MNRFLAVALVASTSFVPALGQTDATSIRWLQKNAIPMRTLAPDDPDFADLERLVPIVGSARIVLLGEQSHGDGTTFLAKNRLIAFLHERMGFDVLCFESGLYDCHKAWNALRAGEDSLVAMRRGIFSIWMKSRQLEPLTDYLGRAARTARPIELCGYDCQLTGSASKDSLLSDLQALVKTVDPPVVTDQEWTSAEVVIRALLSRGELSPESRPRSQASLKALAMALTAPQVTVRHSPRELSFWRQVLESLGGLVEHAEVSPREDLPLSTRFNPRDAQGARNLKWLAESFYPDRKIIVWAASMHLIRNHPELDTLGPDLSYAGTQSMGHHLSAALGSSVFTIAFTAGGGEAGTVFGERWQLAPPRAGSLEDLCMRAGLVNALISVSKLEDSPFRLPIVARPLGNRPMKGDWTRHVDAFVFTKTMEPSKNRYTKEEVEASRDVIAVMNRRVEQIRTQAASANAFTDKGGLDADWKRWVDIFEPTPEARKEAVVKLTAWALNLPPDPAMTWRVHGLLSAVAKEERNLSAALSEIDLALTNYPAKAYGDPSVHSSFQHLANAKAMILVESGGFDRAIEWIAQTFESDQRFQFFDAAPWIERFSDDRERLRKLRDVVDRAHVRRAAAFPDEADRLKKYWESSQELWKP